MSSLLFNLIMDEVQEKVRTLIVVDVVITPEYKKLLQRLLQ